jgi:hypothetical protein
MTTPSRPVLRSQRLRLINHQGDALRLGMNWTEEDLGKPQVLVDSAYGMGHPVRSISVSWSKRLATASMRLAASLPSLPSATSATAWSRPPAG